LTSGYSEVSMDIMDEEDYERMNRTRVIDEILANVSFSNCYYMQIYTEEAVI